MTAKNSGTAIFEVGGNEMPGKTYMKLKKKISVNVVRRYGS